MKNFFFYISISFLAITIPSLQAYGDEVVDTVDEAVNQYRNGDYDGAANNLDYAAQLIRQKKSEALKGVLPDPLEGWEAEPPTSQATGTAVFGGSISVSRTYTRKPSTVTIEIVTDSPVLQSLVMMLNNPVIAGIGGAKLETFGANRGIVQYKEADRSGEVNIVVNDQYIVRVKGQQTDLDDLITYAGAVRYSELVKK